MPLAGLSDLRTRYPSPISSDQADYAQQLLDDAWSVIVTEIPDIEARLARGEFSLVDRLVRVQCTMAARVLRNPNSYLSEQIDDYQYRFDSTVSAGVLYLSDDEQRTLQPPGSPRRLGAFSIVPQ